MFEMLESLLADVVGYSRVESGGESSIDSFDLIGIVGRLLPVGIEGAIHLENSG